MVIFSQRYSHVERFAFKRLSFPAAESYSVQESRWDASAVGDRDVDESGSGRGPTLGPPMIDIQHKTSPEHS